MNVWNIIGRVGKDAEIRQAGNKPVANWSVAVDHGWGDNKQTIWVDCALFGDRAGKLADFIRKGDRIGVTGEMGTREYNGKTYITLNVRDVTLLGEKSKQPAQSSVRRDPLDSFDSDEVPF